MRLTVVRVIYFKNSVYEYAMSHLLSPLVVSLDLGKKTDDVINTVGGAASCVTGDVSRAATGTEVGLSAKPTGPLEMAIMKKKSHGINHISHHGTSTKRFTNF
jgi:hypothetical protein